MSQGNGWAIVALLAVASCSEQGNPELVGCERAVRAFSINSRIVTAPACSPVAVIESGKRVYNWTKRKLQDFAPHS